MGTRFSQNRLFEKGLKTWILGPFGEAKSLNKFMKKTSLKKYLLFVSKAAVTGLLIWLVFTKVNFVELKQHFNSIKGITIVYVLALLCVQSLLAGIRWRIVMALFDRVLSLALTVRIYFEGMFFNQALPSTVGGDGIRIYRVFKLGLPFGAAFNGVLLDRVAGFISLIILVALAQPILFQKIQEQWCKFIVSLFKYQNS